LLEKEKFYSSKRVRDTCEKSIIARIRTRSNIFPPNEITLPCSHTHSILFQNICPSQEHHQQPTVAIQEADKVAAQHNTTQRNATQHNTINKWFSMAPSFCDVMQ
jgi:hypothetical protein